jgi:hypothetical protein
VALAWLALRAQLRQRWRAMAGLALLDRVKITAGWIFSASAAGEAVIDPQLAAMEHLRPGDTLRLIGVPGNGQSTAKSAADRRAAAVLRAE